MQAVIPESQEETKALNSSSLFPTTGDAGPHSGRRLAILHQNAGPTLAYFVRAPAEQAKFVVTELDSSIAPCASTVALLEKSDNILVVRYLPKPWLRVIQRLASSGATLAFLMDDDLLDPEALKGLPVAYQRRLRERITNQSRFVAKLFSRVWVTSAYLQHKYSHLQPHLLQMCPEAKLFPSRSTRRLAYLGTASHPLEFAWLVGLLEKLQSSRSDCSIELYGDLQVNRQFRHIPGVRILHPMSWSSFLLDSSTRQLDVMLCPLLDHPFNRCRAPIKFFDAARMGAVGIYSDRPPYQGFIHHGEDGILLVDGHDLWLNAINMLLDDQTHLETLAANAKRRASAFCAVTSVLPFT
ncbi:hypothetical protein KBY97_04415 [Synechococcus sp. ATX 2A4]|uniref:glycosyltransferase n=1 Tax=Synechococcus sp. ATX 2A4 TaxID=2823727 RepID=UPI0020CF1121|nr:hypothetical protein [Synechococcus sp. ATX 2A4]MCP9884372.1 hypothetical protein [Synechococcus sp. ATX 2A4]